MQKFILIPRKEQYSTDGAVKPRNDVFTYLRDVGYKSIEMTMFHHIDPYTDEYNALIGKILLKSNSGDLIINQVPTYCGDSFDKSIGTDLRDKELVPVALVHDVDALRFGSNIEDFIDVLNSYDVIVVASNKIKSYLQENGLVVPEVIIRGPWDYYSNIININKVSKVDKVLNYAGNLTNEKSGFLYDFLEKYHLPINVWGTANPPSDSLTIKGFSYKGKVDPDKLNINQGWGLIWDENTSGGGSYHKYQEYNWPAKLSLYLRNGVPVIVNSKSNMAKFVKDNGIGITIDSLSVLKSTLDSLSEEESIEICNNANILAEAIADGKYDYEMDANIDSCIKNNNPYISEK